MEKPDDSVDHSLSPPETPEAVANHGRRQRTLIFVLVVLAALLAGVQSGRFLGELRGVPTAATDDAIPPAPDVPHATPPSDAPLATPDSLPDPTAPLPSTGQALTDEVVRVSDAVTKAFPGVPDALEVKARVFDWQGKSEEAVKCWQECLRIDPQYFYAYTGIAAVAAKKEDYAKAVEFLGKAAAIAPGSFSTRMAQADVLLKNGRPKEAIDLLEAYLRNDPRSRAFLLLGQAYAQAGDYEKARANFEAAIRAYPKYTEAYLGLASAYNRLGQRDKAAQVTAKSRELLAADQKTLVKLRGEGNDFRAMRDRAAGIHTNAARLYFAKNMFRPAERLLRRAAALAPSDVDCRQALAALYRREGRTWEAARWLEALAKIEPENINYWIEIGRLRRGLLQYEAAQEAFSKARTVAPKRAEGHAAMADLLVSANKEPAEALAAARKAAELSPTAPHFALVAAAAEKNGDLPGALIAMARAVELSPENPRFAQIYEDFKKAAAAKAPPGKP